MAFLIPLASGRAIPSQLLDPTRIVLQREGAVDQAFDRNRRYVSQANTLYVLPLPTTRDLYVVFVDVDDMIVVPRSLGYKSIQRCPLVLPSVIGDRPGARTFFRSHQPRPMQRSPQKKSVLQFTPENEKIPEAFSGGFGVENRQAGDRTRPAGR